MAHIDLFPQKDLNNWRMFAPESDMRLLEYAKSDDLYVAVSSYRRNMTVDPSQVIVIQHPLKSPVIYSMPDGLDGTDFSVTGISYNARDDLWCLTGVSETDYALRSSLFITNNPLDSGSWVRYTNDVVASALEQCDLYVEETIALTSSGNYSFAIHWGRTLAKGSVSRVELNSNGTYSVDRVPARGEDVVGLFEYNGVCYIVFVKIVGKVYTYLGRNGFADASRTILSGINSRDNLLIPRDIGSARHIPMFKSKISSEGGVGWMVVDIFSGTRSYGDAYNETKNMQTASESILRYNGKYFVASNSKYRTIGDTRYYCLTSFSETETNLQSTSFTEESPEIIDFLSTVVPAIDNHTNYPARQCYISHPSIFKGYYFHIVHIRASYSTNVPDYLQRGRRSIIVYKKI